MNSVRRFFIIVALLAAVIVGAIGFALNFFLWISDIGFYRSAGWNFTLQPPASPFRDFPPSLPFDSFGQLVFGLPAKMLFYGWGLTVFYRSLRRAMSGDPSYYSEQAEAMASRKWIVIGCLLVAAAALVLSLLLRARA